MENPEKAESAATAVDALLSTPLDQVQEALKKDGLFLGKINEMGRLKEEAKKHKIQFNRLDAARRDVLSLIEAAEILGCSSALEEIFEKMEDLLRVRWDEKA